MRRVNRTLLLGLILLLTPALACGLEGLSAPEVNVTIPADAAEQAGNAAATAAAAAGEAGNAAATLAAQAEGSGVSLPDGSALAERFAALQPDESGNVTITVTEAQMNQALQQGEERAAAQGQEQQVQNIQVTFNDGRIILSGNITAPINGTLTVTFRPYVMNGNLQFEAVEATINEQRVPNAVLQTASATMNGTLGTAANELPNNITWQSVTVSDGVLTLNGAQTQ